MRKDSKAAEKKRLAAEDKLDQELIAAALTAPPADVQRLAIAQEPEEERAAATTAAPLTMAELLAEQYPDGAPARVAGGMAIALQRELRRRNRKAEKGY